MSDASAALSTIDWRYGLWFGRFVGEQGGAVLGSGSTAELLLGGKLLLLQIGFELIVEVDFVLGLGVGREGNGEDFFAETRRFVGRQQNDFSKGLRWPESAAQFASRNLLRMKYRESSASKSPRPGPVPRTTGRASSVRF